MKAVLRLRGAPLRMALCVALVMLAACSRVGSSWGTPDEVRIAIRVDPHTLVPMFAIDQRQIDITQLYAQPLVAIDGNNKPYPLLCTEIPSVKNGGISRDARTITYHLRPGVKFADGVELTSADVAFTYRAIVDPRNPSTDAAPYQRIVKLDTPGPYTVVLHLNQPWVNAPYELFADADFIDGILPAHAFHDTQLQHTQWAEHPFGTGPFRVTQWQRGDRIVFGANPYSWQHPKLKHVVMKVFPDQNAMFVALQDHSMDMVELSEPQVPRARAMADVNVITIPRNATEFAHFDVEHPLVADVATRNAIAQAVDRTTIAKTSYHGLSPQATTEIPTLFAEHDATVTPPPYDPAAARTYFKAHPLSQPLLVIFDNSNVTERSAATLVQNQLQAAGIDVALRALPADMIYAPDGPYFGGRYDLEIGGFYGGLSAEATEYELCAYKAPHGPNTERYCNADYDAAFRSQAASADPAVRRNAYHTMQALIARDRVIIPFVYLNEYLGVNPRLHNVKPDMLYNFGNIAEWELR